MANRVLSIETGVWWSKVAVMEVHKNNSRVAMAFSFRTPEHAIEDGYIRDKESYEKALKKELKKRSITEKTVIFTIASSRIVTRDVSIPFVKDKQIEGIVESQVREYFPMDISGHVISHKKLDTVTTETGKEIRLLLVAAPENLLNNYYSFAKEAGFEIQSFDYIGNSTIALINKNVSENAVVVQLEEQATIISMISNKKLMFQRIAPYGYGNALSVVLSHSVLGVYDEFEAFDFLLSHDVIHDAPTASEFSTKENSEELVGEAYADIRDALQYHIRVVYTALDYYKNQKQTEFQGKLYLAGCGARFAGMKELINAEIPLEPANIDYAAMLHLAGTKKSDIPQPDEIAGYLSVAGALIAPMDFTPKEMKQKAAKKSSMRTAYLVLACSALLSVGLVLISSLRYMLALTEHRMLEARIGQLAYIQQIYDENTAVSQEAARYLAFDLATNTENERMGELITQLEKWLPTTASAQSIMVTESKISINITCDTKLSTAQLLMNLEEIPFLGNLSIPSMSETTDEAGNTVWQYTVEATYVIPEEEDTEE